VRTCEYPETLTLSEAEAKDPEWSHLAS
jgi:hypothetical protein